MTPARPCHSSAPAPGGWTRHDRVAAGFTLLEVMLAIVVAAVVLAAVGAVFFGALRLRNRTSAAVEEGVPLQRALARIRRDLAGIVPPGTTLAGSLNTTTTASTNTVSPSGGFQFGQVGPEFRTATGNVGEALPWAEVQRVAYLLLESTNASGGADLYRSVSRNLLGTGYEEPELEWLLGNVESLTFSYYDGTRWLEYWDSTSVTNLLPRGIKVELQRAPRVARGEFPPVIELVVPLLVDGDTNQISEAMSSSTNSSTGGMGGSL